jgi:hypothetical protein
VEKMMPGAVFSNRANARYEAELKAVTKKHGFKNFAEYKAVAASISLVMAAIDSQTKAFTDPPTAIRSLTLALRAARPIQFRTNIELVQKYYGKIYVTMIAA